MILTVIVFNKDGSLKGIASDSCCADRCRNNQIHCKEDSELLSVLTDIVVSDAYSKACIRGTAHSSNLTI